MQLKQEYVKNLYQSPFKKKQLNTTNPEIDVTLNLFKNSNQNKYKQSLQN